MTTSAELVSPAKVFARSTGDAAWIGKKQQDALAHLSGGMSVKVLLGPPSSGKSTILRLFARRANDTVLLPVVGPQKSALGVLSTLLTSADLSLWTLSEVEQRNLLTVFIEQRGGQGKRVAICVDNISEFSDEAWSEIERLTQIRFAGRPMVELIIAGREKDASSAPLDRFLQGSCTSGIEAVHFLSPPDGPDLEGYIRWRLTRFGIHGTFTPQACAAIAHKARGRFNSVNLICQVLLWNRSLDQPQTIDEAAVQVAMSKLSALKDPGSRSTTQKLKRLELNEAGGTASEAGRLVVCVNGIEDFELPLTGSIVIGRSRGSDLRLNSRLISRHHAAITPTLNGRYLISDLNSTNGMLVNGNFVRRSVLEDGDVIDLCEFRIRVELNSAATAVHELEELTGIDDDDTDIMPAPDIDVGTARLAGNR